MAASTEQQQTQPGATPAALQVQILATEHWSLLATRSMTWNEVFSRASMFITMLSAAVVALALVAQASGCGARFRLFALLVLPVVLLMGILAFIRLGDANSNDFGYVVGMNRLRRAYLELAPELQPYFTTSSYDDLDSIMQSYGMGQHFTLTRILASTPTIIAAINVIVAGVIAALVAVSLGATEDGSIIVGITGALLLIAVQTVMVSRAFNKGRGSHRPLFPDPQ